MIKTSNNNCRQYVQKRQEFKGNNLFGQQYNGVYVVYSYGYHWPLYAYVESDGQWYANSDKSSVSTSKHANQAHPCPDRPCVNLGKRQLEQLIEDVRRRA